MLTPGDAAEPNDAPPQRRPHRCWERLTRGTFWWMFGVANLCGEPSGVEEEQFVRNAAGVWRALVRVMTRR